MSVASSSAIPPEIWCEIFRLAEDEDSVLEDSRSSDFERGTFYDVASVPWLPSQVCQRWRKICHSTPSLWSGIVVRSRRVLHARSPLGKSDGHQWLRFMLEKRLEFAGTCPLQVYIYGTYLMAPVEDIIMEVLWPHHTSWEHVHLGFTNEAEKRWLDIALRSNDSSEEPLQFPLLHHLGLSFDTNYRHFPERFLELISYSHTSTLTSASLEGIPTNIPLAHIHPSFWSRLHRLRISFARGRDPPPILPFLENVKRLELRPYAVVFNANSTSHDAAFHADPRNIQGLHTLPSLTDLTLRVSGGAVIQHLVAPRLISLSLTCIFNPDLLVPFIHRSGCATSLTRLHGHEMSFWSIEQVLHELPFLRELKLFGMAPTQLKSMVKCLRGGEHTAIPVPRLQTLVLKEWQVDPSRCHIHDEEMVEALTGMLESRWRVESLSTVAAETTSTSNVADSNAQASLSTNPDDSLPLLRLPDYTQLQSAQLVMQGPASLDRLTEPMAQRIRVLADEGMDVNVVWLDEEEMERVSFVFFE